MKKRIILNLLCVYIFLNLSSNAVGETIRMAVFQLDPYMMETPGGEPGGVTVEYWRTWLAPRMGYDLEVLGPYPIIRVQKMLENGDVDVVSQFTRIPDREAVFLYPETPLTQIISCIIVKNDSPLTVVTKPDDLFGKRLGFLETAYIPPFLIDPRITIELVGTVDYRKMNLDKLFAGRIDAVLDINYISCLYYLRQRGYEKAVQVILLPVEPANVYSIFRKTPGGQKLKTAYDTANTEGIEKGVFDSIAREYIPDAVTDP